MSSSCRSTSRSTSAWGTSTGAPSTSDLATVTVIAGTALWAEVLAKVVLLAGLDVGAELLGRSGVTGIATAHDGTVTRLAGFDAYERRRG